MPIGTTKRITKALVDRMQPSDTIQDSDVSGFGVRKQKSSPAYFLKTYVKGRRRFFTIGKHAAPWTPETARREARRLLVEIQAGRDPGEMKARERSAPTVRQCATEFLQQHGPTLKPRTREEYERLLNNHILPLIGTRKIHDLDATEIKRLHTKLKNTPRQANFAVSIISKFLGWAEEHQLRPTNSNPCASIKRFPENKHQRFLSPDEFKRLGEALSQAEQDESESIYAIAAIRLLILTGARKNEILTLQWKHVDLHRSMIFLPESKTGPKPLFLSRPATILLSSLPRHADNPHVLPGAKAGGHLINLQKPWNRIRKAAGLDDVRIHDLRHSFASIAAGQGGSLPLIGNLLGHRQAATTQRYAHLAAEPVKQLNDMVGEQLADMLSATR